MEDYIGTVKLFAGNFVPRGYLLCDGKVLNAYRYPDLFTLLGNMYGGDGSETFALPDLRSRSAVGVGTGSDRTSFNPGDNGGVEKVALNATHLPDHTHTAKAMVSTSNAVDNKPKNTSVIAAPGKGSGRAFDASFGFIDAAPDMQLAETTVVINATTGGGNEFAVRSPYLAMNYIICVEGIFPPRP